MGLFFYLLDEDAEHCWHAAHSVIEYSQPEVSPEPVSAINQWNHNKSQEEPQSAVFQSYSLAHHNNKWPTNFQNQRKVAHFFFLHTLQKL